jgi:ribonuclease P protein component
VQTEGKAFRTRFISVRVCASSRAHARIGLIVPRFGHTAVARNQLKRRLREAIRLDLLPNAPVRDVLIKVSPRAYELEFDEVRSEVARVSAYVGTS